MRSKEIEQFFELGSEIEKHNERLNAFSILEQSYKEEEIRTKISS